MRLLTAGLRVRVSPPELPFRSQGPSAVVRAGNSSSLYLVVTNKLRRAAAAFSSVRALTSASLRMATDRDLWDHIWNSDATERDSLRGGTRIRSLELLRGLQAFDRVEEDLYPAFGVNIQERERLFDVVARLFDVLERLRGSSVSCFVL